MECSPITRTLDDDARARDAALLLRHVHRPERWVTDVGGYAALLLDQAARYYVWDPIFAGRGWGDTHDHAYDLDVTMLWGASTQRVHGPGLSCARDYDVQPGEGGPPLARVRLGSVLVRAHAGSGWQISRHTPHTIEGATPRTVMYVRELRRAPGVDQRVYVPPGSAPRAYPPCRPLTAAELEVVGEAVARADALWLPPIPA